MDKAVSFTVMRLYHCENRVLTTEDRAIVVGHAKEPGTPVKFHSNGKDYYGDVLECIETSEGSELCSLLEKLAERNVIVHFSPNANK